MWPLTTVQGSPRQLLFEQASGRPIDLPSCIRKPILAQSRAVDGGGGNEGIVRVGLVESVERWRSSCPESNTVDREQASAAESSMAGQGASTRAGNWVPEEFESTRKATPCQQKVASSRDRLKSGVTENHVVDSDKRGDWRGPRNYSRKGQTSKPKSPITGCGVLSAISNERLGNAQLSQGLGVCRGRVGGVGMHSEQIRGKGM